jgi:chromosome segregation ATPase
LREARAAAIARKEAVEARVDDLMAQVRDSEEGRAKAQAKAELLQAEVDRLRAEAERLNAERAGVGPKPVRRRWFRWKRR